MAASQHCSGWMIDGYKLSFSAHEIPALPNSGRPARIVEVPATTYLQGAEAIRVLGRNTELSYDKRTGQMLWCLAGRESVIISGPVLHIMRFPRSEEHTSELQSLRHLVCRLLLEKK